MRPVYNVHDPVGLKLLTRLRVNFSHLREHKFRHNFRDTLNPLCSCSLEIETTNHYLLRCPFYAIMRKTLLDSIENIVGPLLNLADDKIANLLLFGDSVYTIQQNCSILQSTIVYLKSSQRFDIPLF